MTAQPEQNNKLILVPYAEDPLSILAQRLLDDHQDSLPRLEHVTILLPEAETAPRLRRLLLKHADALGFKALLGPRIVNWQTWLNTFSVNAGEVVSDHRRELILVEALRQYSSLFGEGNLWALADSLVTLFDELTLNQVGLPENLDTFTRRIGEAYGLGNNCHQALEREAQLVHTLWHAWHQELHARGLIDRHTRYLLQLSAALEGDNRQPLYLLAPSVLSNAERQWLSQMLDKGNLKLFLHGELDGPPTRPYHPQTPLHLIDQALGGVLPNNSAKSTYTQLFDAIYHPSAEHGTPLSQRAENFASQHPQSPAWGHLSLLGTDGDELEAHAVELQVRRWLLKGRQSIGIITENRRLARRVRALLERAGIIMQDAAGWVLSTTSAAAVLERWLECVEEDFPHLAMLDLVKSPFFITTLPSEEHLNRVFRLELDIIQRENIGSGLSRYREYLHYRQQRLPQQLAESLEPVAELLNELEGAATLLRPYVTTATTSTDILLQKLLQSLEQLGLAQSLRNDAAGMRLLEELELMQQAVEQESVKMNWLEFRSWLGRTLERFHFRPPVTGQAVSLLGLGQTQLARFDALIIAGAEREHLPGSPAATPFFNDSVRQELGLPAGEQQLAERFFHFRRLLECAPQILITFRHHKDGEEILPSPWIEVLRAFHLLAYGDDLRDAELATMLDQPETSVAMREAPLPPASEMPAPALSPNLVPQRYSASAYQQLMNCPYQFYAARGLSLAPPEAIREALEKSDYGERVHLCLQAFHGDVADLPGPFSGRLTASRLKEAKQLLVQISHAVFARDLEDNFMHRGWLQRWLDKIPAYLEWQIKREDQWQISAVELKAEQDRSVAGITLHGRLDRIDTDGEQLAIVDYKTGQIPSLADVESGEAVQLPFYALLATGGQVVDEVTYLGLDQPRIQDKVSLQGGELEALSTAIGERLGDLVEMIKEGVPLPAWGDEKSCGYCTMAGVCRRQAWITETKKAT